MNDDELMRLAECEGFSELAHRLQSALLDEKTAATVLQVQQGKVYNLRVLLVEMITKAQELRSKFERWKD